MRAGLGCSTVHGDARALRTVVMLHLASCAAVVTVLVSNARHFVCNLQPMMPGAPHLCTHTHALVISLRSACSRKKHCGCHAPPARRTPKLPAAAARTRARQHAGTCCGCSSGVRRAACQHSARTRPSTFPAARAAAAWDALAAALHARTHTRTEQTTHAHTRELATIRRRRGRRALAAGLAALAAAAVLPRRPRVRAATRPSGARSRAAAPAGAAAAHASHFWAVISARSTTRCE